MLGVLLLLVSWLLGLFYACFLVSLLSETIVPKFSLLVFSPLLKN